MRFRGTYILERTTPPTHPPGTKSPSGCPTIKRCTRLSRLERATGMMQLSKVRSLVNWFQEAARPTPSSPQSERRRRVSCKPRSTTRRKPYFESLEDRLTPSGAPFIEPPVIHSVNGVLKATLHEQIGTVIIDG